MVLAVIEVGVDEQLHTVEEVLVVAHESHPATQVKSQHVALAVDRV